MNKRLKDAIKSFVKQTMGCAFSDEVFEQIELERNVKLPDNTLLHSKIHIGNRLLIYVAQAHDDDNTLNVPYLLDYGRKQRDSKRFNRFRLVIATDRQGELETIETSFAEFQGLDNKIHVHIIDTANLPL